MSEQISCRGCISTSLYLVYLVKTQILACYSASKRRTSIHIYFLFILKKIYLQNSLFHNSCFKTQNCFSCSPEVELNGTFNYLQHSHTSFENQERKTCGSPLSTSPPHKTWGKPKSPMQLG